MATKGQKLLAAGTAFLASEPVILAVSHAPGLTGVGVIAGLAVGAVAYNAVDDIERAVGKEIPPLPMPQSTLATPEQPSLVYRMFNGKSVRGEVARSAKQQQPSHVTSFYAPSTQKTSQDLAKLRESIVPPRTPQQPTNAAEVIDANICWDESWYGDDDQSLLLATKDNEIFTFSQVLDKGFSPSLHKIYLGRLMDGSDVYVTARDLCHVALAGLTGNGKSSIMRLIMAQLCKIGVTVLLLNPHYMQWDHSGGEDWTPYEPYLEKPPIDCAQYEAIETYLEWMAKTLLPKRIERAREGKPIGKPFFIVIDELPAIVAEIKESPNYIAKILREGRKYGIFLIVASQDFLVKTTGMDGGGVRKCFRTAFYVGGDVTTAKILLNDTPQDYIPENDLGKGMIMLRCSATKKAILTKVPYVDNESLYRLLGASTFSPASEKLLTTERGHNAKQPKTKEQSQTTLNLGTVLALAEKVDKDTLLALIDRLPNHDEKDVDTEELAAFNEDDEIQIQDIGISQRGIARQPETLATPEKTIILGKDPVSGNPVSITREAFNLAAKLRKSGTVKGYRALMEPFDLSEHHAKVLNKMILAELGLRDSESE